MKNILKLTILVGLCYFCSCSKFMSNDEEPKTKPKPEDKGNSASSSASTSLSEDQITKNRIIELFGSVADKNKCVDVKSPIAKPDLPFPKPDTYSKMNYGMEEDAYLFDFLQKLLKDDILKEFETIYEKTKKIELKPNYVDPYSIDSLYLAIQKAKNSKFDPKEAKSVSEEEKIKEIKLKIPKFDKKEYDNSIKPGQMYAACGDFVWNCKKYSNVDFAKGIVDLFDFRGVGSLNLREFTVASIVINAKTALQKACGDNCYFDVMQNKVLPIYLFADCNGDKKVTSRGLWEAFKHLKSDFSTEYSIYHTCPGRFGSYRTNTVNRFVNVASKGEGYLSPEQFAEGILLSFWNRHVESDKLVKEDSRNGIQKRWDDKNQADIICKGIAKASKSIKPTFSAFSSEQAKTVAQAKSREKE